MQKTAEEQAWVFAVMIGTRQQFSGARDETPALILAEIERHVGKCQVAQFVCEALTDDARARAESLRQAWIDHPIAGKLLWR